MDYFLFKRDDADDFVLIGEDEQVFYGPEQLTNALYRAGTTPKLFRLGVDSFLSIRSSVGTLPDFDVKLINTHTQLLSILGYRPVFTSSELLGRLSGVRFTFTVRLSQDDLGDYEIVNGASTPATTKLTKPDLPLPTPLFDERKNFLVFKTPGAERIVVVGRLANCAMDVAVGNRRTDKVWEKPSKTLIRVYVVNNSGVTQLGTPTVILTPNGVLKAFTTEPGLLIVPRGDRIGEVRKHDFDEKTVAILGNQELTPLSSNALVVDFRGDELVGLRPPTEHERQELNDDGLVF